MRKVDGLWYPDSEERLHRWGCAVLDISTHIIPNLQNFRTVVQAGGAAGAWPIEFSKYFDKVYTFEPNPALFACLQRNLPLAKGEIEAKQAALWESPGKGKLVEYEANNMGSWYIKPLPEGDIELLTVDSLALQDVDLIQFDVEGGEIEALKGAEQTIRACKPHIVVEVKGTQQFYGRTVQHLERQLAKFGYQLLHKFGRDQLWGTTRR